MGRYEKEAAAEGFRFILGVDEAGRGPLAGPVVAAAVCLKSSSRFKTSINDSKQMTAKAREEAFHEIWDNAYVGIGIVSEVAIDAINIFNASHLAMDLAIMQLVRRMPAGALQSDGEVKLLIDGNMCRTKLPYAYKTIVDGDALCQSISCASIIAKVYRDRVMGHYDRLFPQYGFKRHKGYSTDIHRNAIKIYGLCRIHRRSFSHGS